MIAVLQEIQHRFEQHQCTNIFERHANVCILLVFTPKTIRITYAGKYLGIVFDWRVPHSIFRNKWLVQIAKRARNTHEGSADCETFSHLYTHVHDKAFKSKTSQAMKLSTGTSNNLIISPVICCFCVDHMYYYKTVFLRVLNSGWHIFTCIYTCLLMGKTHLVVWLPGQICEEFKFVLIPSGCFISP